LKTISPNTLKRIWAAPPPVAHPTLIIASPKISGTERMYRRPSVYSCQELARFTRTAGRAGGRKPRPGRNSREMHSAEIRNESAFPANAHSYPNCITLAPPRKAPITSVVAWVVWVSEFAVCSSSRLAMEGRMEARPLVKNGEANISRALSR
jgi:hypothetical protein